MSPQIKERTVDERLQKGVALKVEGRYDEAERELRAVLQAEPDNVHARRELGLVRPDEVIIEIEDPPASASAR